MAFRTVVVSSHCKLEYSLNYLVYKTVDEIKRINLDEIHTLIIESSMVTITTSLMIQLINKNIKVIICDEKKNPQSELMPYYGDVILNLFSMDVNNKRNLNVVFKQIKLLFKDELSYSLTSIKESLNDCFQKIKIDYNLDLINDIDLEEDDLIKMLNLKIKDESKSLLEKIMIYIKTAIELRKVNFFIFISLSMYLEEGEIKLLLKNCQLFDVSIINIESQKTDFTNFDKKIIIDKDICLLKKMIYTISITLLNRILFEV